MEEKKLWALARITLGLVVLMGIATTSTLVQRGPLVSDLSFTKGGRAPASVISVSASSPDEVISTEVMSTLDLHCLKSGAVSLRSQSRQIRLLAKICKEDSSPIQQTHVTNKSNGFEATIFETGEMGFSTDYIYLNDGPNEIELSYLTESGDSLRAELLIHRQKRFVLDGEEEAFSGSRSSLTK